MTTVAQNSDRRLLRSSLGLAALHGTVASVATALGDYLGTGSFAGWSPVRLLAYFGIHWGVGVLLAAMAVSAFEGGRALAGAAFARILARDGAPLERRAITLAAPWLLLVLAAYPALHFATLLFSGASASKLPFRDGLVAATTVLVLAGAYAGTFVLRALGDAPRSVRRRRATAAGLAASGVALTAVNQLVLPNLYPAVHAATSVATLGAFAAASVAVGSTLDAGTGRFTGRAAKLALFGGATVAFLVALFAVERAPVLRLSLFDPRASVSQSLMRVIDPVVSAIAAPDARRARASSIETAPVDALGGPVRRGTHVILITVDALRADHLGLYGYGRPTSPAIDALAREAVVFDRAYAQAPHSSYSLCSLMTSEYLHDTLDLGVPLPHATLPGTLREHGYHTAGIYTRGIFHTDGDRLRAYDERRFDLVYREHRTLDAEVRTDVALAEIDRVVGHGAPPTFLWVHYFDAHEPYRATTFGERDIDRYDSEIRKVDGAVDRLVREARKKLGDQVVFVLTADHGEEFRDHGGLYHGSSVYEEQVRVPLLILVPGLEPRRVTAPVELVDIAPTLLRLAGVEVPSTMRGDDLRGVLVGNGEAPRMAVAAVTTKRAIIEWPYKLVQDDSYRLVELFDLARDPHERTNLAGRDPARVAALESDLAAFLDRLTSPARSAPDRTLLAMRRGRLRDPRALAPLMAIAADESAPEDTRREAARLLGSLRDASARDVLASLLAARDSGLATEAAIALAQLGDTRGKRRLVAALGDDSQETVRFRAAVALGALGDTRAVPVLIEALDDGEDDRDRRLAAQFLGMLEDPRAVEALIAALSEFKLRASAAVALGAIGDRRAYEAIVASLETDRHAQIRDAMAQALGQLGDPRAIPLLVRMASDEPDLMNATRAVIRLGGLDHGVVGGASLWGRRRPPAHPICPVPGDTSCAPSLRAVELALRVPPSLRTGRVQAVLRARVGADETATVTIEIGGHALDPVELDGQARELRVPVPAEALVGTRVDARLTVPEQAELVVDHLLLLPIHTAGGV